MAIVAGDSKPDVPRGTPQDDTIRGKGGADTPLGLSDEDVARIGDVLRACLDSARRRRFFSPLPRL